MYIYIYIYMGLGSLGEEAVLVERDPGVRHRELDVLRGICMCIYTYIYIIIYIHVYIYI